VSLSRNSEIRRCGKRYGTETEARCSKRGLQQGAMFVPCRVPGCGGWHVTTARKVAAATADTGPSRKVRALVVARDLGRCVCCGRNVLGRQASLQHRRARGMGGTSEAHANCCCNLVLMLGSATTLCHGRAESRRYRRDKGRGYVLEHGEIPALTAVMVFDSPGGPGMSLFPTCDGNWSTEPGQVAA
jgi:hypothetical protein